MEKYKILTKALFLAALMPLLSFGNGYADSSSDISMREGDDEERAGGNRNRNAGTYDNRRNTYPNQAPNANQSKFSAEPGLEGAHPAYRNVNNNPNTAVIVPGQNQVVVPVESQDQVYVNPYPEQAPQPYPNINPNNQYPVIQNIHR